MRLTHRDDPETGDFPGERVFASKVDVKYVLHDATDRPDTLVVAFGAASETGKPPHYRWNKVLGDLTCHRLFVLDDHGPRDPLPRPNWYLGQGRGFATPDSICELIDSIAAELRVNRRNVVTVGSSMGGWAALYFGVRVGAGHAIVGEPQTRLGDYLCGPAFHELAEHIAGGSSDDDAEFLDAILFDAFREADSPPNAQILCGRESPYLELHVRPLAALLDELGLPHQVELVASSEHPDIAVAFPSFLRARLGEIMSARESEVGSHS